MATVVLSYAGAALGTLVGGPIGGIIGRAVGGIAGNLVDQRLFGTTRRSAGPRLNDLRVMASEEGAAIPVIWGRMRVSGQVIWATNLEEVVSTEIQKASSKGGPKSKTTSYSYFGNFAIGLCEGEIDGIGRVWADGKVIDIEAFTTRLYTGSETQLPDSLISAVEGAAAAPAYRGVAYIVFERLPLERFGNRFPQLSIEVFRRGSRLGQKIGAVNIIPGSTEFGYDTALITRSDARGQTVSENAHASAEKSDWSVSMDQLQAACPNLQSASLVVPWFGDDLRCGSCTVRPRVDNASKVTTGATWQVSGETRASAMVVSNFNGAPAYGGTPSDATVIRAIQDLHQRGIDVTFYPFLLMDIPADNDKTDPYGGAQQQTYPWRGNLTCGVAPNLMGTPDKTAAVNAQLNAFGGNCTPAQFFISGDAILFFGPAQWSYRRMILHYAKLCAAAGGVEVFLIGSELRGLTRLRGVQNGFPFVEMLRDLALDVKTILPSAKVSYAADWSEYFGYHPTDGSGDVYFNLDTLWSSSAIDFIGIDNYMPLADWRDGQAHSDVAQGSIYNESYLASAIAGGEGFDWYYASQSDRDSQIRTAISDGAYGKPWVYRNKDLVNWWSNLHFNRPGGIEAAVPTAWVPQSKPIWFTEAGCPAVDKGANQPNVFYDAKSAESAFPYHSGGQRDDVMQHRFIAAVENYWSQSGSHNPVSSVYGATMLCNHRIAWWAWDARPFPAFPVRIDVWSDGANYARGHWLNGRLSAVDVGELISTLALRFGLGTVDVSAVNHLVDGFVLDRPMSGRDALEALLRSFALDAVESEGIIKIRSRDGAASISIARNDLVESGRDRLTLQETRLQETYLPRSVRLAYVESSMDYRTAAVQQCEVDTASSREIVLQLPAAVPQSLAQARVDVALAEAWGQRTSAQFTLLPSQLALEPGDVIAIDDKDYRLSSIVDAEARASEALQHDASVYDVPAIVERSGFPKLPDVYGPPDVVLMDLAVATTTQPAAPWIAAQAKPWPGRLNVLRLQGGTSYAFNTLVGAQATMGETVSTLPEGIIGRVDYQHAVEVVLNFGALSSVTRDELLAGANLVALGTQDTGFEILQYETAELTGNNSYRLRGLLRAQAGSFAEMLPLRTAGQRIVLLNGAVSQILSTVPEAVVPSTWRIGPANLDHGHPAYVTMALPPTLKGLRPLRPTHLRAKPAGGGVLISWTRQTRSGGDAWEIENVPLFEERESYQLEVMNGANVVRRWTPVTGQQFYSDAEMLADFSTVPSTLSLRIAQMSAAFGAGTILEGNVNV